MNSTCTRSLRLRLSLPALLAAAVLVPAGLARAQEQGRREAGSLTPAEVVHMQKFTAGGEEAGDGDQGLLERAARFYVDRLTYKEYQRPSEPDQSEGKTLPELLREAFSVIPVVRQGQQQLGDAQQKYLRLFAKPLVAELKAVLHNPVYVARINAALILARLGQTGLPVFGDPMADVVEDDKQSDAVKVHALHGLRNLLELMYDPDGGFDRKTQPQRDRWAAVLLKFLTRKDPLPANAPQEEQDGVRYVRREAVRALGSTRVAIDQAGNNKTALALVRLLRKDGYTPEPAFSEQIEAAIAVARLSPKPENYQVEYALHQVGQFLVEFLAAYGNERPLLTKVKERGKEKEKDPDAQPPSQAWIYQAARIEAALADLKELLGNRHPYATDLIKQYTTVLDEVKRKNPAGATELQDWLKRHPVPAEKASVYQGDDKSVVGGGGGAASE
jgi:hypothetical protein